MEEQQELSSIINSNNMLLSFEGWIKYIEGFSRGLQTTKTVDAGTVFDCVGEIMEYMKQLKGQIIELLLHCENVLEKEEICNNKIQHLETEVNELIENNKELTQVNDKLLENLDKITQENEKLKQAIKIIEEKNNGKM